MDRKPTLYIMIGCPGSGKSTWAKQYKDRLNATYVSRDEIRFGMLEEGDEYFSKENAVYAQFVRDIAWELTQERDVIADASHLNQSARRKLINALKKNWNVTEYDIVCVCMRTSLRDSLERNAKRTGRACVPNDVIVDMYEHMTKPEWGELHNLREIWTVETLTHN